VLYQSCPLQTLFASHIYKSYKHSEP
jgi:hypothetical protein